MAKIYTTPGGAVCIRFGDNTGWWAYNASVGLPLIRAWRWCEMDDEDVEGATVLEVSEGAAYRYAKMGGPWIPRIHDANTQEQIEDAWCSRHGEYPDTEREALWAISDITATAPAEATTMVVADVYVLARTLVRKVGVAYEDDDWDLVGALQRAIDGVAD